MIAPGCLYLWKILIGDKIMDNDRWLTWAMELQDVAQAGLYFGTGKFDLARYEQVRKIAAAMISDLAQMPIDQVTRLFCSDVGYVTPKLDSRAAIFKDGKILLVQEESGSWSMPGGWVDADRSIMENVKKEAREEAGLIVKPRRLIALQDLDKNNVKLHPFKVIKAFVLCDVEGGHFKQNDETIDSRYFGLDELPRLSEDKTTREQISFCFRANEQKNWETIFD